MSDQVIISTPAYTVTKSRVEINGKTYFIKNISSIVIDSVHIPEKKKSQGKSKPGMEKVGNIGCLGVIIAILMAIVLIFALDTSSTAFYISITVVSLILFVSIAMGSISVTTSEVVVEAEKTQYEVLFDTNSGKITAYITFDRSEAYGLKAAIEQAASNT
ncbi:DUF6232 family protein [Deinococcus seoulensis]|uniref:DUF6232 family protein n=1 Tax=Deinococcus seoulensis TaxID=1837379 RepID=UPI00166DE54B|nr:DUF6232 family protein [Deinococcus seoulensis]